MTKSGFQKLHQINVSSPTLRVSPKPSRTTNQIKGFSGTLIPVAVCQQRGLSLFSCYMTKWVASSSHLETGPTVQTELPYGPKNFKNHSLARESQFYLPQHHEEEKPRGQAVVDSRVRGN